MSSALSTAPKSWRCSCCPGRCGISPPVRGAGCVRHGGPHLPGARSKSVENCCSGLGVVDRDDDDASPGAVHLEGRALAQHGTGASVKPDAQSEATEVAQWPDGHDLGPLHLVERDVPVSYTHLRA